MTSPSAHWELGWHTGCHTRRGIPPHSSRPHPRRRVGGYRRETACRRRLPWALRIECRTHRGIPPRSSRPRPRRRVGVCTRRGPSWVVERCMPTLPERARAQQWIRVYAYWPPRKGIPLSLGEPSVYNKTSLSATRLGLSICRLLWAGRDPSDCGKARNRATVVDKTIQSYYDARDWPLGHRPFPTYGMVIL
jgi:hypothetical protein